MTVGSGFWSAVQFLTRIPVPRGNYRVADGLVWFPIVGLLLGGLLAGADWSLRWLQVSALVVSTLIVVMLLVISGALHADGLMDTCDAVFGHASPDRRLEIMRDPRVGTFGAVGLVCIVALKIAAVDALPAALRPWLLFLAPGLGRWSIVLLATLFPYGRPGGSGVEIKAAATPRSLALASLVPLAAVVVIGPVGIMCGGLAALIAVGVGRWLLRLLPGLTGDCYGASCEVVEAAIWLNAAPLAHALA